MHADPMHVARLAQLEGALCALLHAAASDHGPDTAPDEVVVRLNVDGLDIEYYRCGLPVGGEGV